MLGVATPHKRRVDAPAERQGNVAPHAMVPRMAISQNAALSSIARATVLKPMQEVRTLVSVDFPPAYKGIIRTVILLFANPTVLRLPIRPPVERPNFYVHILVNLAVP